MFNNTDHVHCKYMSSDMSKIELLQEQAYPVEDPILKRRNKRKKEAEKRKGKESN